MNKNIVFKQPKIQNAYFLHEQFLKKINIFGYGYLWQSFSVKKS